MRIRAIRPDDKGALMAGFRRLSEDTVYRRFFHNKRDMTPQELEYYTEIDFVRHVGLVAVIEEDGKERIIGGGRYIGFSGPSGESRAELAFTVADDFQGLGLATHFLRHLIEIARAKGIEVFEAEVLSGNRSMLRVFEKSGLPMATQKTDDTVQITLSLAKTQASRLN